MAQVTFYGNQQTSSANVFANGPAEKADYNITPTTLHYNPANPGDALAVGDTLFDDPGFNNVFQGGGTAEWVYMTDTNGAVLGNYAVKIDGSNQATLGEVLDIEIGPDHLIEFQDLNSATITSVNENVPFKLVVTESGAGPSMSPVVTITGSSQVDVNDFDTGQYAWPFTSNTTDPQNPVDDFTVSFTNGAFSQNFKALADSTTEGNEVFAVQLSNGKTAAVTIQDTSVTKTIEWDDTSDITGIPPGGSSYSKDFTITGNNAAFNLSNHVGYSDPNQNWVTLSLLTLNNSGGTMQFIVSPNTTTSARSLDITLIHPDGGSITSTTITLTQTAGNAAPVTQAYSKPIVQDTQGTTLNFASGQGWSPGTPVTDTDNSFANQDLDIVIVSVPGNGSVFDDTNSTVALTAGATLANNSGNPTIIYNPNSGYTGTDSFQYKAVDAAGNESTNTVTITVNTPVNQPPFQSNPANFQVNGFTGSGGESITANLATYTDDDNDNRFDDLEYEWYDINTNQQLTLTQLNTSLAPHGTVTEDSTQAGFVFTFTQTANFGPNDSNVTKTFYYRAKDLDNEYSVGLPVNVLVKAPVNNAPVFTNTSFAQTLDQYSSTSGTALATDQDGDTLTWSIVQAPTSQNGISNPGVLNLDVATGSWTYEADYALSTQDVVTFIIGVSDGFDSASPQYTAQITVNPINAVGVTYSSFSSDGEAACSESRPNDGYINTLEATNIDLLQVGDSVYTTSALDTKVVSTSSATQWISVEQTILGTPTTRALQIDSDGEIINIVECEVVLGNAWPIEVNYDDDVNDLCAGTADYQNQTVYQNVVERTSTYIPTLAEVVGLGGQLFTDEVIANTYLTNTAPANLTVNSGYYNDTTSANADQYYEFQQGQWIGELNVVTQQTNYAKSCPADIDWQTFSVSAWYDTDNRTSIDTVCSADAADLERETIWFRADASTFNSSGTREYKLLYLLQNQLVIFTSEEGANTVDYSLSWPSTTFLLSPSDRKFVIWENDNSSGYSGNFRWKGVNGQGEVSVYTAGYTSGAVGLGICSTQFERPSGNSQFIHGGVLSSRENTFYAFLSCVAKFEDGKPYWPLYIIDGQHTIAQNSSSYIKEFVDVAGQGTILNGNSMLECMSIQHKINAVNIDDAQDILNDITEYSNDVIRTIQVNPVDLGFTSGAEIGYGFSDCAACLQDFTPSNTFTLANVSDAEIINKSIPNFDLEKNYSLDELSKPLLRTNPKVSTNAKLLVNSQGKMYIEAIEATKELASVEYKKWAVNKEGQWAYDLYRFFSSSKTPADQIYQVKESYSNFAVQETFENQIEEDYHYGTVYNYSKIHDEDFRMLAPIWLDKNIPNKFVIFRVKDPVGTLDFDTRSNLDNIKEILKNSEVIKTFDLTRKSELGTYIRNHVQSESFPKTPITMNFDKNQRSSFNGIDLDKGGFTSKGEYLDQDLIAQDSTIISANELITDGFKRNKLACANLINLEFLFNDDLAADYSVNRYFGLYVNDIDSGYGTLETANGGKLKFKTLNSYINNDASSAIPPFKLISETPTLAYASTSEKFYKISSKVLYNPEDLEVNVEDSTNSIASEIKLAKTGNSIDIKTNNDPGSDFVKVTLLDVPAVNDGFAIFPSKEQTYRLKFTRLIPQEQLGEEGWKFTIVNPSDGALLEFGTIYVTTQGIQGVANYIQSKLSEQDPITGNLLYPELYNNLKIEVESDRSIILAEKRASLKPLMLDFLPVTTVANSIARIEELQVPYDIDNNTFFALNNLPAGGFGGVNFSNQGTIPQITSAIVKSINSIDNGFTALSYDGADHFYIKTNVKGYRLLSAGIAIPNSNANQWISVDANNLDTDNLLRLDLNQNASNTINDSAIYYFNGGNGNGKSVLVTLDSASDVNIGDSINTKSRGVYNKVIDIVDDIERLPLQYKKLILEKVNSIESGEVPTYADNLVRIGLFSAFDIHDMNFDFYDTANSDLKELAYETAANIAYEPELDDSNDIYPFGDKQNTEYTLDPAKYFVGLSDILTEEQADVFDENQITSEFDRLQENYLKEYAIRSRVVPSINKWVLKDTLTVREQPYYLNANEAFGRSNFAPDLSADGRNRLGMTHEWFYINNLPTYFKTNSGGDVNPSYTLNDSFSYLNFMDGFEITPALFKDINYDYFDRFFVTEGFEIKADNNYKTFVKTNRQKKYTKVDGGNNTAFASTIFKGLRFTFKNRKEFTSDNPVDFVKSSEFNGYRFSTLLNVKTAQESNGVEYEVIQNKKFKFVVFLITLSLDDLWADGTLNRKLLYELNHSLVWKQEDLTFDYADVKVDGALDLLNANLTDNTSEDFLRITGYQHGDGTFPQFLEQINKDEDSAFGTLTVKLFTPFGPKILNLPIAALDGQDRLILRNELITDVNGDTGYVTDENGLIVDLSAIPHYLMTNAEYRYARGGINAYTAILDALAARDMAEMLLRDPNNIKFTTIETNGTSSNNKFIILMDDGNEVVKNSFVVTTPDTDKPESFKLFRGNIGYNLDEGFTYYPFLIRQNGGYTVDTRPVVTFTDIYTHMKTNTLQSTADDTEILLEEQMYKHSLTDVDEINLAKDYYRRYNRCGVAFNLGFIYDGGANDSNWGYIRNHFYRKVNEFNAASVTKLSTSTDKLPLYPLIGEVAIDKKNVHVFKSSWDKNYYTRALSGGTSEEVPGTFETKEEKSYLASTIMKIRDSYTLLDFTVNYVESEEEQDQILIDNTNTSDLVVFESDSRIVVDFYITDTVKDKLSTDGVFNAIQQYVAVADSAEDKTTLVDDADLYIEENLINLFSINQIKLFTSRIKGQKSSFQTAATIDALDDGGYAQDQNFTFRAHEQKPLNFRLIYNKRLGYSYRIRPMIKITS